ncbi:hypothetical protein QQY66_34740 [Streptomyces sp. DG2A-72]|uniref:hypothetical protein n=1 Tax=Streptomyces sp. DG2A-72 TaxID=3051386 RepID=UPI00265BC2BF|nr:hypothetical protein [Streptomyces sp. DG2A-72]MDO0936618.1 hypothetical protein [Streptomyces sp. DG2A-72]
MLRGVGEEEQREQADGHDATTLFAAHPTALGVADEQLDAALAALTGVFLVSGAQLPGCSGSTSAARPAHRYGPVCLLVLLQECGHQAARGQAGGG